MGAHKRWLNTVFNCFNLVPRARDMDDILLQALSDFQNGFSGGKNTCELFTRVSEVMPMNTENYKIVNVEGTTSKFKASIKVGFKSEEDIAAFIKNYAIKNNETLTVSKTRKTQRSSHVLVKYFRCHHKTRHEGTKFPDQILASDPNKRFKECVSTRMHCTLLFLLLSHFALLHVTFFYRHCGLYYKSAASIAARKCLIPTPIWLCPSTILKTI